MSYSFTNFVALEYFQQFSIKSKTEDKQWSPQNSVSAFYFQRREPYNDILATITTEKHSG